MRKQPVVSHADANIDGQHIQHDRGDQAFPGKHEQGDHSQHMKDHHGNTGDPVDAPVLLLRLAHGWKLGHPGRLCPGKFFMRQMGLCDPTLFHCFDCHQSIPAQCWECVPEIQPSSACLTRGVTLV